MEKIIVAQQYTTKMGIQGWAVGITGERKFRMFLRTAKKAMGYMFILKLQTGLNISDNCLQRLSFAHKEEKSLRTLQEEQERIELSKKIMDMADAKIDEEMKKEAAKQRKEEKEAKKQRRTKKNSK